MFTGIIETQGVVARVIPQRDRQQLVISAPFIASRARDGESIAINGVCLTVAARRRGRLSFDVVAETLRQTTLGTLRPGERVNLERALRARDRLDGHMLLGHVDDTARVAAVSPHGQERWIELLVPRRLLRYCLPKGSIAVDGVSLTIGAVRAGRVRLYLIPTTLRRTTLGQKRRRDRVNLEADILVKTALQSVKILASSARVSGPK